MTQRPPETDRRLTEDLIENLARRGAHQQCTDFWRHWQIEMRHCQRDQMHSRPVDGKQVGEQATVRTHDCGHWFCCPAKRGQEKAGRGCGSAISP